jgi:hypothetical protein
VQAKAKIMNGELTTQNKSLIEFFAKNEGKEVSIDIKIYKPSRSDAQNRYYWAVVVPMLADDLGYTRDEMHEALKYKFLREDYDNGLSRVGSTADLNVEEFAHYITVVQIFAAELGIVIPDPNQ